MLFCINPRKKRMKEHTLDQDSPYKGLEPGAVVYFDRFGKALPDAQQPKPKNIRKYLPHNSTRYKNVIIGRNGKAKALNPTTLSVVETDKELPELYDSRDGCCGCSACYCVCPVMKIVNQGASKKLYSIQRDSEMGIAYNLSRGAIYLEEDEEGFLYPVVDASLCVRCYKCIDVCPIKQADSN